MNINKITLTGRLTKDPELKMSQSNVPVLNFTVAVNRKRTSNDKVQIADFIDCVCFNKTAEFVSKYFKKGSLIIVFGTLHIDIYEDKKNGTKQRYPKVIVDEVMFGESKKEKTSMTVNANDDFEIVEKSLGFDFIESEEDLPF